jgi:hypothetical protein
MILFGNHKTAATEVRADLNILLEQPVSTKTVRRELHLHNRHSTAATDKPLITETTVRVTKMVW